MQTNRLLQYLIDQCAKPSGVVGAVMINIWNKVFINMAKWGLSNSSMKNMDNILEIGCGGGTFLNYLLSNDLVASAYGIDVSPAAIAKATKLNQKHLGDKLSLQVLKAEEINFENNYFDIVFAIQTHIYWDDLPKATSLIYNSLTTGGEFNIICEKDKIKYHLCDYLDTEVMIEMLLNCGFSNVNLHQTDKWIQYQCQK